MASERFLPATGKDGSARATLELRLLSFVAHVSSSSPRLLNRLASLYPTVAVGGPLSAREPMASFAIDEDGSGGGPCFRVAEGGVDSAAFPAACDAVAHLEYLINGAATIALSRHLLIHAGAVSSGDGVVLLPGPSGAGKSTLVAALCLSGFGYLSDEVAVLAHRPRFVLPFLKSICLKAGGWRALRALHTVSAAGMDAVRIDGEPIHYLPAPTTPSSPTGGEARYILLPTLNPDISAELLPISRAVVVTELARNSLNLPRHGRPGLDLLVSLAEGARCYRLVYGDLRAATNIVTELVHYDPRPSRAGNGPRVSH